MESEKDFVQHYDACQGYLKLDMVKEAWEELKQIDASHRPLPEVVQLRVWVLMKQKKWEEAFEEAEKLCRTLPEIAVPFLDAAYCLHELHKTEDARAMLLNGPEELRHYPTFHYNLACYEATLGHVDEARQYLERAITMNPKYQEEAKGDPDLKSLWG